MAEFMTRRYFMPLLASVLLCPAWASSPSQWKIGQTTLKPRQDGVKSRELRIDVSDGKSHFALMANVNFPTVKTQFISKNRLVVIGDTNFHNSPVQVIVFDLSTKTLIDRFAAWEVSRISESWIAFVEWYPEHAMRWPTDVVLIYDLDKSPNQNRVAIATETTTLSTKEDSIEVGFPVYPKANATDKSYTSVVPSADLAIHVLGAPYFAFLPDRWLVFIAAQGTEYKCPATIWL